MMSVMTISPEVLPVMDDDELTRAALAADADVSVDASAPCLWDLTGDDARRFLPEWYMPAPIGGARLVRGWRRWTVLLIILAFVIITAYGLCNTYDQIHFG